MYAIRARRKTVTEKDFLDAVNKVIKGELASNSRTFRQPTLWLAVRLHDPQALAGQLLERKFACCWLPPLVTKHSVIHALRCFALCLQATRSSARRPNTWCTTEAAAAPSARQLVRSGTTCRSRHAVGFHGTCIISAAPPLLRLPVQFFVTSAFGSSEQLSAPVGAHHQRQHCMS